VIPRAIPERLRGELLSIKCSRNRHFTLLYFTERGCHTNSQRSSETILREGNKTSLMVLCMAYTTYTDGSSVHRDHATTTATLDVSGCKKMTRLTKHK